LEIDLKAQAEMVTDFIMTGVMGVSALVGTSHYRLHELSTEHTESQPDSPVVPFGDGPQRPEMVIDLTLSPRA